MNVWLRQSSNSKSPVTPAIQTAWTATMRTQASAVTDMQIGAALGSMER